MTYIAARTGYDFVSLRLIPMGVPGEIAHLPEDKEMIRKTKAALKETGIGVLDLELARITEDVDPLSYLPAMETAAELGAKHVISSAWTSEQTSQDFVVERYAEICDLAKPFGLTVDLEFPTFSRLTNLQEAVDVVTAADRSNGGIFIDTLYFLYSGTSLKEIEELPRDLFHVMHICDAPEEIPVNRSGMVHIARDERLYLGEGCIDFSSIISRLPPIPYSIELPNIKRVKQFGYEGHARRCLESAQQQLEHIETGVRPVNNVSFNA
jgi:sugar phosphate isomerase/epimerase